MEKIGFWSGFIKSLHSFKDYPRYAKDSGGKTFLYTLLLTVILIIPFTLGIMKIKSSFEYAVSSNSIPHWNFNADDTLTAEKKVIFDQSGTQTIDNSGMLDYPEEMTGQRLFILDTDIDFEIDLNRGFIDYFDEDSLGEYYSLGTIEMNPASSGVVLIGKHGISIYGNGRYQTLLYSELDSERKEMLSYDNVIDMINSLWVIILIVAVIFGFIGVLIGCVIQTAIACIQNSGKTNYTFGTLYKLAVHARTIPTLIVVITSIIGFKIPFGWLINYIIGAVIMQIAIKSAISMNEMNSIDRTRELNSLTSFDTNNYNTPFNNINGEPASYNNQANLSNNNSAENGNSNDYTTPFNNPNGTYNSGDYGINSGYHSNDDNNN